MEYITVLFWSLIGSVFSLIGGVILLSNSALRERAIRYGLPFGAGALLAAAFLGVFPEAVEGSDIHTATLFGLGGFLAFFVLERMLGWFHHHEQHHKTHDKKKHSNKNATHQSLVIIGDTLHNAIDGVAIGAAFLVDPAAGIGTAVAVAAHEIPQEIGDFGILLGKGMKPRTVLFINLFSALATVVTALIVFTIGDASGLNPAPLLAVAAGFFIYIAASDIIPEIHEREKREADIQAAVLLIGVVVLAIVIALTPHSHAHDDDHHHETHEHESAQQHDATPDDDSSHETHHH